MQWHQLVWLILIIDVGLLVCNAAGNIDSIQFSFFLNETVHHFEVPVQFALNCFLIVQFSSNELKNSSVQFGHSFWSELNFAHP